MQYVIISTQPIENNQILVTMESDKDKYANVNNIQGEPTMIKNNKEMNEKIDNTNKLT